MNNLDKCGYCRHHLPISNICLRTGRHIEIERTSKSTIFHAYCGSDTHFFEPRPLRVEDFNFVDLDIRVTENEILIYAPKGDKCQ